MNCFAKIISFIFSPLGNILLASFFLVYITTGNVLLSTFWFFYSLIFSLIVELFIFYGIRKKFFSDFNVTKREQRGKLYVFCFILTIFYILGLYILNAPKIIFLATFTVLFLLIILFSLNRFIKASGHAAFTTVFISVIILLFKGQFTFLFFLIPLVSWSRIKLKEHKLEEVIVGTIVGILTVILIVKIQSIYQLF